MKILSKFSVLVLLLFLAATLLVSSSFQVSASSSSSSNIRGIMSELREQYDKAVNTAANTFTCLDGSKTMKLSRVNDQHCDCADGSDEPGSSACTTVARAGSAPSPSSFRFQCTNEGFPNLHKQVFFHSRVNDGICDCCDGSDEYLYPGSTQCPNICADYSAKVEEEEKKREAHRQAGLRAREALLVKAKQQRSDWTTELQSIEGVIEVLKKELEAAEAEVVTHEVAEKTKRAEIHQESLAKKLVWDAEQAEKKKRQAEEQQQVASEAGATTDASIVGEKAMEIDPAVEKQLGGESSNNNDAANIECISWRQTKDCSGSGEREPHGDRSCNQIIESGASGYCECKADGNDETYPFDCAHRKLKCDKICLLRGADDAFEDDGATGQPPFGAETAPPAEPQFQIDDGSSFQLPEADDARRKRDSARRKLTESENSLKELQENLAKEYGTDDIFLGLANECVEKQAGEFTYKICPMKEVFQGHTSLGKFKSFGTQTYGSWGGKSDYTKQKYDDGVRCWGGPARNCEVILVCGPENIITSVEEPSMCSYKMVFQTPAICE